MTREEAIKEAYGIPVNKKQHEALQILIPELKENDDERIRKWIKKEIEDKYVVEGIVNNKLADEAFGWLEKQKHLYETTKDRFYREGFEEGQLYERQKERKPDFDTHWENGSMVCEQKEQKPILEVFGFKVGDAVRLKDGDGRKHIIKSFEEIEGLHGPNFYHVEFEDNSARDGIYPGEEYPNGYYTQMEKFEEEQKPNFDTHWENGSMVCEQKERKPIDYDAELEKCKDNPLYFYDKYVSIKRKSAEWDELQSEFKNINEAFEDGKKEVVAHPEKYGLCDCVPAGWDEEDSDNLERVDNYLWMLDDYVGDDCTMPQGKTDKIRGNIRKVLSPWLKSLPERFNLQPKQEWSEEDERNEQKPSIFPPGFGEVRWNPISSVQQKPMYALTKDQYVEKFRSLCDLYEIKLPNRTYDIYHLCDDLAELFGNTNNEE